VFFVVNLNLKKGGNFDEPQKILCTEKSTHYDPFGFAEGKGED
jgi:hypothetical protein